MFLVVCVDAVEPVGLCHMFVLISGTDMNVLVVVVAELPLPQMLNALMF